MYDGQSAHWADAMMRGVGVGEPQTWGLSGNQVRFEQGQRLSLFVDKERANIAMSATYL